MGPVPDRTLIARGRPGAGAGLAVVALAVVALAVVALAVAAALAGCGGKKASTGGASSRQTVTISVAPSPTSNHGRPLHAIVRTVTLKQFAEDPYASVAGLVVNPDESVLAAFVVFPGVDQAVTIDQPAKGALAVYFLFTGATGTTWKQLYDSPPSKIRLELGDAEIVQPGAASSKPGGKGRGKGSSRK